jgi:predicted nucleotidyltransferase
MINIMIGDFRFRAQCDLNLSICMDNSFFVSLFIKLAHELEDLFKQKIDLVSRRAIQPRYLPFVEKSLIHV